MTILILLDSLSNVTQSTRTWVPLKSMTNAACFAFVDMKNMRWWAKLFLSFQRKILIWMTFVDCEDRLISSECNQIMFVPLVQIPSIDSSECIGFIHMATAKSVKACEVQMLWKSCLFKTCQPLYIYKSRKGHDDQYFHCFVSQSVLNSLLLRSFTFERFLVS